MFIRADWPVPARPRQRGRSCAGRAVVTFAIALTAGLPWLAFAAAGDLDTTFNQTGKRVIEFNVQPPINTQANGVAVQKDGKVVLALTEFPAGGRTSFALIRLNRDGSTDASFGGGVVVLDLGTAPAEANAVAVQKDGKIVAAGYADFGVNEMIVARYTSTGTLDTTFGLTHMGLTAIAFSQTTNSVAQAIALQKDGRILVAGSATDMGGGYDFAVARLGTDGIKDGEFDGGGVTTDFGGDDLANAIALQGDGKIVVAGRTVQGNEYNFALARYKRDGTLDPSFGQNGKLTTDFGFREAAGGVAVRTDGRIVAAGVSWNPAGGAAIALARYQKNGRLDHSFGQGGRVRSDLGDQTDDPFLPAMVMQGDGKIVVVGARLANQNFDFLVARYQPNGRLDRSFNHDGWDAIDFGGTDRAASVAMGPNGRIVPAGATADAAGSRAIVARYLSR